MVALPFVDVACVLGWWVLNCGGCTLANVNKTTCHVVRYPPQFSTHHRSTQATSTQG